MMTPEERMLLKERDELQGLQDTINRLRQELEQVKTTSDQYADLEIKLDRLRQENEALRQRAEKAATKAAERIIEDCKERGADGDHILSEGGIANIIVKEMRQPW